MTEWVAGGVALAIWIYLAVAHGRFWGTSTRLPCTARADDPDPARWPSVVAVVPARNEAAVLPRTLASLLSQRYPGAFRVVVVDDDSTDGTGELAAHAGADVVVSDGPSAGWAGKVAAMAAGVAAAGDADYILFTDADIAYPPDAVRRLVRAARSHQLVLTSQMVRLRIETRWESVVVPAFAYFFAQLYPFARVNGPGRTAAAAGGCMLVERDALTQAGGLAAIRGALIDDVALGRLLKRRGRIWLGLASDIVSVRPYPRLGDLWQMVTRSAYTQLRYSPALLLTAVAGLLLVYALPPALLIGGLVAGAPGAAILGAAAWATMTATFVPMLRFYRLGWMRALLLPALALVYAAMTVDSARLHYTGRGGQWKGRVLARDTRVRD